VCFGVFGGFGFCWGWGTEAKDKECGKKRVSGSEKKKAVRGTFDSDIGKNTENGNSYTNVQIILRRVT